MTMRSSLSLLVIAPLFLLMPFASTSCSSDDATPVSDGDASTDANDSGSPNDIDTSVPLQPGDPTPDDAGDDAETIATEVEPNDGKTTTEVGTMALPGTMNGAINPANDVDLFSIALAPGDLWDWTATPTGTPASLAPHITIFDTTATDNNPTRVAFAAAGSPANLQHFVFNPGTFVVGVRDARNVPDNTDAGGPTFGYALNAKRSAPTPTVITFPSTNTGKLAGIGALDFYTFGGTAGKGFDVVVNAARKLPPSTLDSRLSLYDLTANAWVATNDNAPDTTDSQLGSDNAVTNTYLVIVENEGTDATDLSYEIKFTLRP